MILATIPDPGVTPEFHTSNPNATQRTAVDTVIQALDQDSGARQGAPLSVVDMYSIANRSLTSLTVGGVKMTDAGGTSGKDEFLSDGFHPGTVVQGLMANAILMADNIGYHDPVTYLTDQYMLTEAGVTHSNTTSYFNVSPYVIAPEPSTLALADFGTMAALAMACRRRDGVSP